MLKQAELLNHIKVPAVEVITTQVTFLDTIATKKLSGHL